MKKFAVLILSSTLCACSANVAPGADVTPTLAPVQSKTFENKIQGPNLSGDWKSDCNPDKWSSNYVSFHIKIKNQDIVRDVSNFADRDCTQLINATHETGRFRFMNQYTDVYELEYELTIANATYTLGENVELKGNNTLMISDRYTGSLVQPDIALSRTNKGE